MTHRHEWDMVAEIAYCIKCDALLKQKDIRRRLNAVECLPAYAADMMGQAQSLFYEEGQGGYSVAQKLIEYAKALGYEEK